MSDDGKDDFAATGRASDDEVLPASERKRSPLRTLRGDIAVAIVVLGIGGLIVRALISGHSTKSGVPTPTPTATVSQAAQSTGLVNPPACPRSIGGRTVCTTVHDVPPAFLAAVRAVLPNFTVDQAVSRDLRPERPADVQHIWSRTVTGHEGQVQMTIIVSGGVPTSTVAVQRHDSAIVVTYVRLQQAPYTVQIRVVTLARLKPTLNAVVGLARDPRLVQRS